MIAPLLAAALLVATLFFCVVASMAVEQWSAKRRAARAVGRAVGPAELVAVDASVEPDAEESQPATEPATLPVVETRIELGGRDAADRAVGVLLAAYVASGGPAARRAAAWVTASGPSSLTGPSFEPGADLRGRTVAVRRLLEHDEAGRCWVTLRSGVDIARGLQRLPVTCPTLIGVLLVWKSTRAALSVVGPDDIARIVAAIDELSATWTPTTGAAAVEPVADGFRAAEAAGGSAVVSVPLVAAGDVLMTSGTPSAHGARVSV